MKNCPSIKLKMYPGLVFLILLLSWSPVNLHVSSCGYTNTTGSGDAAQTLENKGMMGGDCPADTVSNKPYIKGHSIGHIRPHYPILFH